MSDVSADGGLSASSAETPTGIPTPYPSLTVSASYRESSSGGGGLGKSSSRRRPVRPSFDAAADNEFMTLLHGSDPVKVELNRLENEVRGAKMLLDLVVFVSIQI